MSDFFPIINDDTSADNAVQVIQHEREEAQRLIAIAQNHIAELNERIKTIEAACEAKTAPYLRGLKAYLQTVKTNETKTQRTYRLLSGTLVEKKPKIQYKRDDEILAKWLMNNGYDQYVTHIDKPSWGELKTNVGGFQADSETGCVTIAATGELVEGVTATLDEGGFDIR